jgi:hypothetical protein
MSFGIQTDCWRCALHIANTHALEQRSQSAKLFRRSRGWTRQYLSTSLLRSRQNREGEGFERACNPPLTRVPRGRPRKQRLDKGNYRATRGVGAADLVDQGDGQRGKRTVICGTCGEEGHYYTTCRRAHN